MNSDDTTTAPHIFYIFPILRDMMGFPGMGWDDDLDGLRFEDQVLTAEAIQAAWDRITPDTNEDQFTDPDVAIVFGAVMGSADCWIDAPESAEQD